LRLFTAKDIYNASMKLNYFFCVFFLVSTAVSASDEDTYKAICANCHSINFANSPQIGNKAKWAPLIAEGQVTLTAHGYVGVRAMPPKGGKPDLTVQGFSEALNYMVNQSGGNWKQPDKKMMDAIQAEIIKRQKLSATK
jgi:mono/diheme cytochrome c family protein